MFFACISFITFDLDEIFTKFEFLDKAGGMEMMSEQNYISTHNRSDVKTVDILTIFDCFWNIFSLFPLKF